MECRLIFIIYFKFRLIQNVYIFASQIIDDVPSNNIYFIYIVSYILGETFVVMYIIINII